MHANNRHANSNVTVIGAICRPRALARARTMLYDDREFPFTILNCLL
jgi:hypothetical protein